jgi:tRNA A-37 threonylcarbamoyl transferase component Bud32
VYKIDFRGKPTLVKERFAKSYRIPELDTKITKARTLSVSLPLAYSMCHTNSLMVSLQEVRCVEKMRAAAVDTPQIYALVYHYHEDIQTVT